MHRVVLDPGYLLALARAFGARIVVSGDAHPKELKIAGIRVITPRAFLDALRTRVP